MSHTYKDQPGGHVSTFLETNGGDCWNTMKARRFGKKFARREARREANRITRAAVMEAGAEREWFVRQEMLDALDMEGWGIIDGPAWEDDDARNDICHDYEWDY